MLSNWENVAEFREKFGLGDEEVEAVLSAVREENQARARGESRRVIESGRGLPVEQVRSKVETSDYDEKIMASVART